LASVGRASGWDAAQRRRALALSDDDVAAALGRSEDDEPAGFLVFDLRVDARARAVGSEDAGDGDALTAERFPEPVDCPLARRELAERFLPQHDVKVAADILAEVDEEAGAAVPRPRRIESARRIVKLECGGERERCRVPLYIDDGGGVRPQRTGAVLVPGRSVGTAASSGLHRAVR